MPMSLSEEEVFSSETANPSCLLYEAFDARFEDRAVPQIQEPNDVIVRIAYTGVCGSDVHFWTKGGFTHKVSLQNPVTLGHEASGTIVATGSKVNDLDIGDRVAIEPGTPCRECKVCKAGSYHFCSSMKFAAAPGPGEAVHGTLTRYYKLPGDFCYKLAPHVSLGEGVLAEPLAVAVHAARLANVKFGESVVVFGAGPVGVLCATVAQEFGARKVAVVDINQDRLDFAQSFRKGISIYVAQSTLSAEGNARNILELMGIDRGIDTVLEVTGAEPSIQTGIHVLRRGGSYVQTGLGKLEVNFPIVAMSEKELHVHGCFRYGAGDFDIAVDMINNGQVNVRPLISHTFGFEEASQAWEMARAGKAMKALIKGP